jgi:hypothetical protein
MAVISFDSCFVRVGSLDFGITSSFRLFASNRLPMAALVNLGSYDILLAHSGLLDLSEDWIHFQDSGGNVVAFDRNSFLL